MCFSTPEPPPAPKPQPRPTRDETTDTAQAERRRLANQQGVFGNIFTSSLGDPGFGRNVQSQSQVAALGAGA